MTRTILTVDDSPSIRLMVAATLRRGGYTVVEAVDGLDALERAHERDDVALVLTDQNMPHMDGLTLTRSLRAQAQYARTPILMLTTESSSEMKAAGKAAGLTGWMVKPFDPKTLLAVLDKVLG